MDRVVDGQGCGESVRDKEVLGIEIRAEPVLAGSDVGDENVVEDQEWIDGKEVDDGCPTEGTAEEELAEGKPEGHNEDGGSKQSVVELLPRRWRPRLLVRLLVHVGVT